MLSARGGELEREFAFGSCGSCSSRCSPPRPPRSGQSCWRGRRPRRPALRRVGARRGARHGEASLRGRCTVSTGSRPTPPRAAGPAADRRPALGDAPSLRWLDHMARRLEGLPLALVAGTRPPEQSEKRTLLTELLIDPEAVVLRPGAAWTRVGGGARPRCLPAPNRTTELLRCMSLGDGWQPALPARAADHARVRRRRADGRSPRACRRSARAGGAGRLAAAVAPARRGGCARTGDRRARPDG